MRQPRVPADEVSYPNRNLHDVMFSDVDWHPGRAPGCLDMYRSSGANDGPRPRVSMAISMHPEGSESERRDRIECWRRKRAPSWWRGWKGQVDPEPGDPAELTSLGRRLVGLEPWP
jgi:hypothetical protein